jgi:multicomponent Na+:H+ antiporter subunit G
VIALEIASAALLLCGAFFFLAGTVGLLRFPDVYTRLHALTKVDNLGLGLIVLGLMLQAGSIARVLELALIWLLSLAASATAAHLIADSARRNGVPPWRRERK